MKKIRSIAIFFILAIVKSNFSYAYKLTDCQGYGGELACIEHDNPGYQGPFQYFSSDEAFCATNQIGPYHDGYSSIRRVKRLYENQTPGYTCFETGLDTGGWENLPGYSLYLGCGPKNKCGLHDLYAKIRAGCRAGYIETDSYPTGNGIVLCAPLCSDGTNWFSQSCKKAIDIYTKPPTECKANPSATSHPIYPIAGNETYSQPLGLGLNGWSLQIDYNSIHGPWGNQGTFVSPSGAKPVFGQLGKLWWSNLDRRLAISPNNLSLQAIRGRAQMISFRASVGSTWIGNADQRDTLSGLASGQYLYRDQSTLVIETYSPAGLLQSLVGVNGMPLFATQSNNSKGNLSSLTDPFGRQISFTYKTLATGDIAIDTITDPAAQTLAAAYDTSGNLTSLTWQDSTVRRFVYDSSNANQSWAFTGVIDENNKRHATITYDPSGWAKSSESAGGVDKYVINYATPPQAVVREVYDSSAQILYRYHEWIRPTGTTITQPNGSVLGITAISVLGADAGQGSPRAAAYSQPAGAGCSASSSALTYDNRGNIDSQDDFNGKRVCQAYETGRNFETVRIEGLNGGTSGTSCVAALAASNVSTLTPEARKISTEWHPDWKLETRRAEPGKITTWVYNGQPDPFNGNAVATCTSPMYGATSVDLLPDGKPIAVLCKQVVQSTTDVNGSQGFAATLQPAGSGSTAAITSRTVSYTYNQYGQVLTSTDERGQVTTNTYYDATTATHTKGDLWKVTNPLGHVTEYTQYNPHGQVLQVRDPNDVVTSYTYDLRQRLTSVTQAGQLTQIDWWPTGLLKKVTQPDGSWLFYAHDDAHRLTDITDNLGNTVHYELDNAGNRKTEQVKDVNGALTRQINRNYDALNRLWKTSTGAAL